MCSIRDKFNELQTDIALVKNSSDYFKANDAFEGTSNLPDAVQINLERRLLSEQLIHLCKNIQCVISRIDDIDRCLICSLPPCLPPSPHCYPTPPFCPPRPTTCPIFPPPCPPSPPCHFRPSTCPPHPPPCSVLPPCLSPPPCPPHPPNCPPHPPTCPPSPSCPPRPPTCPPPPPCPYSNNGMDNTLNNESSSKYPCESCLSTAWAAWEAVKNGGCCSPINVKDLINCNYVVNGCLRQPTCCTSTPKGKDNECLYSPCNLAPCQALTPCLPPPCSKEFAHFMTAYEAEKFGSGDGSKKKKKKGKKNGKKKKKDDDALGGGGGAGGAGAGGAGGAGCCQPCPSLCQIPCCSSPCSMGCFQQCCAVDDVRSCCF